MKRAEVEGLCLPPALQSSVLFVCLGNICRSPTAEGVFRAALLQVGLADRVFADSAGIGDWHVGAPPDRRAIQAARRRGYDLTALRGRQVTAGDFSRFGWILAMDLSNLRALELTAAGRVRGAPRAAARSRAGRRSSRSARSLLRRTRWFRACPRSGGGGECGASLTHSRRPAARAGFLTSKCGRRTRVRRPWCFCNAPRLAGRVRPMRFDDLQRLLDDRHLRGSHATRPCGNRGLLVTHWRGL